MSKYIRTENNIYETITNESVNGFYVYIGAFGERSAIRDYEIVKQANTIEELCDSFYWDCEDRFNLHNFMSYPIAKDTWDEYVSECLMDEEKPDRNMYGCIKTSEGLIYVAKMNKKGVFELI